MGDVRFAMAFDRLRRSKDLAVTLHGLTDEEVVHALAHASREHAPYLANVLATEALNRLHERRRWSDLVETFYHVHDQLGIGLVIVEDGRLHHANDAFQKVVGHDLAQLRAMPSLLRLVAEDDRATVERDFRAMIEGRAPMREREVRLLRNDGRPVAVAVHVAVAPRGHEGAPDRLVCVIQPSPRQPS